MPDGLPVTTPLPPSRWTPQAVFGLLCLIAATVLRRVIDDDLGKDLGDGLMLLGGSLIGWAPSLPPIKPGGGNNGGSPGSGVIVGIVLATLSMVAPGCAVLPRNGETLGFRLRDDPKRPPPACLYRLTIDGELLHEGAVDQCPAVPVCEEP